VALPSTGGMAPPHIRKTGRVTKILTRLVGVAIDCRDAGPVARFYESLLGLELRDFSPPHWAQLWDRKGGIHLNIQGDTRYQPPTWPERSSEQAKMMHFEIEVEDVDAAVALAIEAGGTEAAWQPPERDRQRIRVMLDPAGHPLCLFLHGE